VIELWLAAHLGGSVCAVTVMTCTFLRRAPERSFFRILVAAGIAALLWPVFVPVAILTGER